ncbi:MAG: HAD family hydrolase [Gammaproteobacteria bacterium]|jgi:HAD superfamily hydrolase (TIGR01490 family)|nr:HAD family hydrolase [Gammaproteobacteria bacterium]MBT4494059.1 HAD family hydrolase [Gammaproteobacteria bacterium]MBT7371656.1 HAD family hydrolase [Gammaproteobacteria bacterium]
MALAIFDLDETLIATDSDHEWGQYVAESGLVDGEKHKRRNDEFYDQYKAGQLDINEYLKFSCSVLANHPLEVLNQHRTSFVDERIRPNILTEAMNLVSEHRAAGDYLMVITSTIEFVTRPIVNIFGIETLIASIPELINDRYTGNIIGVPSFAEGKVKRLNSWLEESTLSLEGSFFYSDSHNDLPLLRLVDHPVAVDPDPVLRREAEARQWKIISLR